MPSPTTVLQIARDGLSLTNAVGNDQTLTADESAEVLRVFNDLIEDWSTQDMAVFGQVNQTFNTVAGQGGPALPYTIGPGGTWVTTQSIVRINDPAYSVINGVTFPCASMTQGEYNLIAYKDQPQQFPYRFLFVNDFPLAKVFLYPVPNAVVPMTFSIDRVLTQATSVGQTVSFPAGYAKAFKYAMAVELAPAFGKKITQYPDVVSIAQTTFANIKRPNKKARVMTFDPAYGDTYYNRGGYRGY